MPCVRDVSVVLIFVFFTGWKKCVKIISIRAIWPIQRRALVPTVITICLHACGSSQVLNLHSTTYLHAVASSIAIIISLLLIMS